VGKFVCRFDGTDTFDLIDKCWYCSGNAVYECVLKYFEIVEPIPNIESICELAQ